MNNNFKAAAMRIILSICIAASISMMYYVNIIKKDYLVFTNPDGPIMLEE